MANGSDLLLKEAKERYLEINPLPKKKSKTQVVIGFVGLPGSGKTTMTGELMKVLPLFRISGDDLRDIFRNMRIDQGKERERLVDWARRYLLEWALAQGFSVIWDGDLIREFFEIKERVKTQGIPLLAIKLKCSETILLDRLEGKGKEYIRALPRWRQEHKESELDPREFFHTIDTGKDLGPQVKRLVEKTKHLREKTA